MLERSLKRQRDALVKNNSRKNGPDPNGKAIVQLRDAADPRLAREKKWREEEEVREWQDEREKRSDELESSQIALLYDEQLDELDKEETQLNASPKGVVRNGGKPSLPKMNQVMKKVKEAAGLKLSQVPKEIIEAEDIELEVWSPIVDDNCVRSIARSNERRVKDGILAGSLLKASQLNHKGGARNMLQAMFPIKHGEESGSRREDGETVLVPFEGIRSLIIPRATSVTDNSLLTLANTCTSLRRLNVEGCERLTDTSLRALAKQNRQLEELNLSECPNIQGSGLVTVGECCSLLRVLKLRNCPASEEWLLKRIATGLPELREIDLSQSHKVSDDTLRTLASRCKKLEKINLAYCREVSDIGVLAISEHCHGLEYLDLTRTKLKHKITDVSLLSLAERCPALTTLLLPGNELLTDVGVCWLSSGCHALEVLNIAKCFKVTDVGLRGLGEGCPELRVLDMAGLKEITDVGLRSLGEGCSKLERINCTNIYLLTDGVDRDFGVQGLQYLATACTSIQGLVLNGCFQVGPRILKELALGIDPLTDNKSFKYGKPLKTLCLSKVPKLNAQALAPLLEGPCGQTLVQLNVSHCENIRDKLLQLVGRHCASIRVLNVSHCQSITSRGLTSLCRNAKAKSLRDLDVSHCPGVSDLGILALSEGGFDPGLVTLNLSGCSLITETGIAWLAEGLKSLMSLNVLNCEAITLRGMKAIAGGWSYVVVRNEVDFFGIYPEDKCEHMRFIDDYGSVWKAAILIQNTYRSKVARRDAAFRREERLKHWTARKLQAYYRGRVGRRYAILKKMQRNLEVEAATKLQCAFRSRVARNKANTERERRYKIECERAAIFIQTRWRGKMSRDILAAAKRARREYMERCERAATKVQRIWRGLDGRRKYTLAKAMWLARQAEKESAANKLQGLFRGRQARKEVAARRRLEAIEEEKKVHASLMMQKAARGRLARKKLIKKQEELVKREAAAIKLQCMWRSKKGAYSVHLLRQARHLRATERAATLVQSAWRAKQGRTATHLIRMARLAEEQERSAAAERLQCLYRQKKAKHKVSAAREHKLDLLRRQDDLESWAAIMVQKVYRGKIGRRRAKIFKEEKMRRWKEMFDYEQDRVFYYNQDTGEVRWRMPQDLLDLLAKPLCSNCTNIDAMIECGICAEYFCEKCWGEVHFGGYRKEHTFRSLYDAYGKRVDYGDGEWPSIWPSEIEQDDLLGWHRKKREEQAGKGEAITAGIPGLDPALEKLKVRKLKADGDGESDDDEDDEEEEEEEGKVDDVDEDDDTKKEKISNEEEPQKWRKLWDYENDCELYFDAKKRRVRFDRPKSYNSPREEDAWKQYFDQNYQVSYYYNVKTGESTYTCPDCLLTEENRKKKEVDTSWVKSFDSNGKRFFHNEITGISTYERPGTYETPREEVEKEEADRRNSPWSKFWDDTNGMDYYYNATTQVSQYERPPDYYTPRALVWQKYRDEENGRDYYFCETTGNSQYMRPEGFETPRVDGYEEGKNGWFRFPDPASGKVVYQNWDGRIQYDRPMEYDVETDVDQNVWSTHYDDEGIPYFFNVLTSETTYEKPKGLSDSIETQPEGVDDSFETLSQRRRDLSNPDDSIDEKDLLSSASVLWNDNEEADVIDIEPPSDWSDVEQIQSWLHEFKEIRKDKLELTTPALRPEVREIIVDECDKLELDSVQQGFGRLRKILITRPI